ncbi:Protein of unknown function [Pyronema omphalodes CBS 100304]|uniref:Uncharacterized protein n=1 Tax=Pyronema omphalodes (strain CBS 100304) TaxID=1076935 RepID=U4LUA0_PYROM|nr:Protein of unknown function [Pyronema omphalodes CBS 100304]
MVHWKVALLLALEQSELYRARFARFDKKNGTTPSASPSPHPLAPCLHYHAHRWHAPATCPSTFVTTPSLKGNTTANDYWSVDWPQRYNAVNVVETEAKRRRTELDSLPRTTNDLETTDLRPNSRNIR